jgi:hypothetical protein
MLEAFAKVECEGNMRGEISDSLVDDCGAWAAWGNISSNRETAQVMQRSLGPGGQSSDPGNRRNLRRQNLDEHLHFQMGDLTHLADIDGSI